MSLHRDVGMAKYLLAASLVSAQIAYRVGSHEE